MLDMSNDPDARILSRSLWSNDIKGEQFVFYCKDTCLDVCFVRNDFCVHYTMFDINEDKYWHFLTYFCHYTKISTTLCVSLSPVMAYTRTMHTLVEFDASGGWCWRPLFSRHSKNSYQYGPCRNAARLGFKLKLIELKQDYQTRLQIGIMFRQVLLRVHRIQADGYFGEYSLAVFRYAHHGRIFIVPLNIPNDHDHRVSNAKNKHNKPKQPPHDMNIVG